MDHVQPLGSLEEATFVGVLEGNLVETNHFGGVGVRYCFGPSVKSRCGPTFGVVSGIGRVVLVLVCVSFLVVSVLNLHGSRKQV